MAYLRKHRPFFFHDRPIKSIIILCHECEMNAKQSVRLKQGSNSMGVFIMFCIKSWSAREIYTQYYFTGQKLWQL